MKTPLEVGHSDMVNKLLKSPNRLIEEWVGTVDKISLVSNQAMKVNLLHIAPKLCSESGELMDCVGKFAYYNQELDMENMLEELGDIEFYLEAIRQAISVSREDCLKANMQKLAKRYENFKYSDQAAKDRKDKQ